MNPDDPKLTAFALNELDEPEKSAIARAVTESPEAQRAVDETRELAQMLKAEYAAEDERPAQLPANLFDIRDDPWFWSIATPLAVAAVLAIGAIIGGVILLGPFKRATFVANQKVVGLPENTPGVEFVEEDLTASGQSHLVEAGKQAVPGEPAVRPMSGDVNAAANGQLIENPFVDAATNPLSTFSIDVGTASYSDVRRIINSGSLPPRDAVRVEEMINYFSYDYREPEGDKPFSIDLDATACPWEANHRLLRIGLKGRKVTAENGTPMTIAKDAKIQVQFNPARVASYRLIGYEKRMLRKETGIGEKADGSTIAAGHMVTALYEVVPSGVGAADPDANPPSTTQANPISEGMVTVKLRYKKPEGATDELMERSLVDNDSKFEDAAPDLKFAAAVAEFGMILRDSKYKGRGTLGAVIEWAEEGKGRDATGPRAGFIELARKTQALRHGEG